MVSVGNYETMVILYETAMLHELFYAATMIQRS